MRQPHRSQVRTDCERETFAPFAVADSGIPRHFRFTDTPGPGHSSSWPGVAVLCRNRLGRRCRGARDKSPSPWPTSVAPSPPGLALAAARREAKKKNNGLKQLCLLLSLTRPGNILDLDLASIRRRFRASSSDSFNRPLELSGTQGGAGVEIPGDLTSRQQKIALREPSNLVRIP